MIVSLAIEGIKITTNGDEFSCGHLVVEGKMRLDDSRINEKTGPAPGGPGILLFVRWLDEKLVAQNKRAVKGGEGGGGKGEIRKEVLTLGGKNKGEQRGVACLIRWLALRSTGLTFSSPFTGNIFNEVL